MSNLRTETIQVAAVAAAMAEDFRYGEADATRRRGDAQQAVKVSYEVYEERVRQDDKFGEQHHAPAVWLAILMEEVGELANEIETGREDDELHEFVRHVGGLEQWARRLAEQFA